MSEAASKVDVLEDIETGSIANAAKRVTRDEHTADIDEWADSLERLLEDVPRYMCNPGHPGRISRIPDNLREVNLKAYEPYFLSIGPYHNRKPSLQNMEKRKRLFLKCVLQQKPEHTLKDYLIEIKNIEQEARRFYSDIEMESESFVQMLLLDSLYILNVFCGMANGQENMDTTNAITEEMMDSEENNQTGNDQENEQLIMREEGIDEEVMRGDNNLPRWFWILFAHDVFLLENQLPFFVLKKIYVLVYGGHENQLIRTLKVRIGIMLAGYTKLDSEMAISPTEEVYHLLHLCLLFFRPTIQPEFTACEEPESCQIFRLGSAVQLYESGVSFIDRPSSTEHSLLDITFCSGKMVMPCLDVDDNTNSLLRNLIALEQMKYPRLGLNVSAYAVLLLHLITIPDDVELLRKKRIIQHHLASDKEMMYLVNQLSMGLAFDYVEENYSLKTVFQELKIYSKRRTPRWRAWLKHRHCSNPWTAISLMAGSLLIFLYFVQTYYTVLSNYHTY